MARVLFWNLLTKLVWGPDDMRTRHSLPASDSDLPAVRALPPEGEAPARGESSQEALAEAHRALDELWAEVGARMVQGVAMKVIIETGEDCIQGEIDLAPDEKKEDRS